MQERWIADRALLQQLMQKHPEWTQPELTNRIGRSLGWVKKWVKRLREAPPGDTSVLFGKPFGRKTPYPQTGLMAQYIHRRYEGQDSYNSAIAMRKSEHKG